MQNDILITQNTSSTSTEFSERFVSLGANKVLFTDSSNLPSTTGIGVNSQFIKGDGSLDNTIYLSISPNYVEKTSDYTVTLNDYTINCTANSFPITLLSAVGIAGKPFNIKNTGTGTITINTTSDQTIDGELTQTITQWENIVIQSTGANWIIL